MASLLIYTDGRLFCLLLVRRAVGSGNQYNNSVGNLLGIMVIPLIIPKLARVLLALYKYIGLLVCSLACFLRDRACFSLCADGRTWRMPVHQTHGPAGPPGWLRRSASLRVSPTQVTETLLRAASDSEAPSHTSESVSGRQATLRGWVTLGLAVTDALCIPETSLREPRGAHRCERRRRHCAWAGDAAGGLRGAWRTAWMARGGAARGAPQHPSRSQGRRWQPRRAGVTRLVERPAARASAGAAGACSCAPLRSARRRQQRPSRHPPGVQLPAPTRPQLRPRGGRHSAAPASTLFRLHAAAPWLHSASGGLHSAMVRRNRQRGGGVRRPLFPRPARASACSLTPFASSSCSPPLPTAPQAPPLPPFSAAA